ncbi:hypothetical protein ACFL1N_10355 [Thermodesulfobacteriota bacterium]
MDEAVIVLIVFFFIAVITGMGIFAGIYKEKIRTKTNDRDDKYLDYDLRLDKLEQRIANIETLVLEKETDKKFSSL